MHGWEHWCIFSMRFSPFPIKTALEVCSCGDLDAFLDKPRLSRLPSSTARKSNIHDVAPSAHDDTPNTSSRGISLHAPCTLASGCG